VFREVEGIFHFGVYNQAFTCLEGDLGVPNLCARRITRSDSPGALSHV